MKSFVAYWLTLLSLLFAASNPLLAADATWNLNPISNDWNTATNWTPATVPDGQATVNVSNRTEISAVTASVGSVVFNPGASAFTISTRDFSLTGLGVINNAGVAQNFVAVSCGLVCGSIGFIGSATVSGSVSFTTEGPPSNYYDWGSFVTFHDNSSAGDGTYHNQGGSRGHAWGGATWFYDSSTAGNSTFILDGGMVDGTGPGGVSFWDISTAGNAVIIANGSTVSGAGGGLIWFGFPGQESNVSLGNATLICNSGVNGGGGGNIWFSGYTAENTNTCRVELFGNGTMLVEQATSTGVDVGSVEGDGIIVLGEKTLSVGRNNLDTSFTGLVVDDNGDHDVNVPVFGTIKRNISGEGCTCGSLTKTGTGMLTLTGANTYSGATTVTSGTLVTSNAVGSATGTSSVNGQAGTLGGKGIIEGAVTIGTGSGTGAVLAPSVGTNHAVTLRLMRTLTFKADGTYTYKLNTNGRADLVRAKGITIESGAQFAFQAHGNHALPGGTIFTAISNTSANPISGTFANLPDGSTFTAGRNNFQVSYEGGDGNDLTLTVVPQAVVPEKLLDCQPRKKPRDFSVAPLRPFHDSAQGPALRSLPVVVFFIPPLRLLFNAVRVQ
jgi:autotransporter-associated beta strand protein